MRECVGPISGHPHALVEAVALGDIAEYVHPSGCESRRPTRDSPFGDKRAGGSFERSGANAEIIGRFYVTPRARVERGIWGWGDLNHAGPKFQVLIIEYWRNVESGEKFPCRHASAPSEPKFLAPSSARGISTSRFRSS